MPKTINPDDLVFQERYAEFEQENVEAALRKAVDRVERLATEMRQAITSGAPDHRKAMGLSAQTISQRAADVLHPVLWAIANMDIEGIMSKASVADVLRARIDAIREYGTEA